LTPGLFRPGTEVAASSSLVRDLLAAIETEGVAGRVGPMTAWVDAAFLNEAGIPAVCFGPGSIADAHAAVEWVPVGEVEAGARILTRFAGGFLKGS
jgi:acetylornithine deacetylase